MIVALAIFAVLGVVTSRIVGQSIQSESREHLTQY